MHDEFSQALLKSLQAQVRSLLEEVSVLRLKDARIRTLEDKIESVVEYTKQLQEQNKQLTALLSETQSRDDFDENKLRSTILKLQYQVIQKNGLIQDLRRQQLTRASPSPARKRREQVEREYLQTQLVDKERFRKQLSAENSRLRKEIQKLAEQLEQTRQAEKQQQKQINQLKNRINRSTSDALQLQRCRLRASSLQSQLTDNQIINAALVSQNDRLNRACQLLVRENQHFSSNLENVQKQLSLEAQRHSLQLSAVQASNKHSQTEVLKLKGKVKAMQSQQEKLQSQSARLMAAQQGIETCRRDKLRLEQELEQLGLQSQFNKKRLFKNQQDLAFLQRQLHQAKEELQSKVKRIYDLELASKELSKACQELECQLEASQKQRRNLAQLSSQLHQQIEKLGQTNLSLKTAMQNSQYQASERNRILVEQLEDLKTSHSTREKIMRSESGKLREAMLQQEKELNLLRVRVKLLSEQIERGVLQPNKLLRRVD